MDEDLAKHFYTPPAPICVNSFLNVDYDAVLSILPHLYLRVTKYGENPTVCTRDVRPDRLNVEVDVNGKISKIVGWG